MSSDYGSRLKISIFGQSHSDAVGVVMDGLPAGFSIDIAEVGRFMARRAPSNAEYSTGRREADIPHILSGIADGRTCGAPLCAVFENTDVRSEDYCKIKDLPRPSHADFTAYMKYNGFNDVRGGGHLSGRLTAPLCFAGGVCRQILKKNYGVTVAAHIYSINGIPDSAFDSVSVTEDELKELERKSFPAADDRQGAKMLEAIASAKARGDSVGGIIECCALGLKAGIGDPIFDGLENKISSAVFAIPAVKGIEFGAGFESALMLGTQNNDEFCMQDGEIRTKTNNAGGILGGISTGMPLIFRAAVKPTPSVACEQGSVSLTARTEERLSIQGRHDACIVPRAVPCVEAACAVALLDLMI